VACRRVGAALGLQQQAEAAARTLEARLARCKQLVAELPPPLFQNVGGKPLLLLLLLLLAIDGACGSSWARLQGPTLPPLSPTHRRRLPQVALCEWLEPIFPAGHWSPQLIHLAGAAHPLNPPRWAAEGAVGGGGGRTRGAPRCKAQPSSQLQLQATHRPARSCVWHCQIALPAG
jgi:hypothetical protein